MLVAVNATSIKQYNFEKAIAAFWYIENNVLFSNKEYITYLHCGENRRIVWNYFY